MLILYTFFPIFLSPPHHYPLHSPLPPPSSSIGGPTSPNTCGVHHPTRPVLAEATEQSWAQQGEEQARVLSESNHQ